MGFVTALGFAIFIKRNHGCKMHIEILEVCLDQETKELDQIRIWIRLECKKNRMVMKWWQRWSAVEQWKDIVRIYIYRKG